MFLGSVASQHLCQARPNLEKKKKKTHFLFFEGIYWSRMFWKGKRTAREEKDFSLP